MKHTWMIPGELPFHQRLSRWILQLRRRRERLLEEAKTKPKSTLSKSTLSKKKDPMIKLLAGMSLEQRKLWNIAVENKRRLESGSET